MLGAIYDKINKLSKRGSIKSIQTGTSTPAAVSTTITITC